MVHRLRQDWKAERVSDPECQPNSSSWCTDNVNPQEWVTQHQQQLPRASSQPYFPRKLAQLLRNLWHRNSLSQRWCFQIAFPVGFSQPVCTSGTGNAPQEWAPQLPSHVVKNLLSLISTYHPSGSNPERCEPHSVFKMWRGKQERINTGIVMGFAMFSSFPRNSVFDKLYFNVIQH